MTICRHADSLPCLYQLNNHVRASIRLAGTGWSLNGKCGRVKTAVPTPLRCPTKVGGSLVNSSMLFPVTRGALRNKMSRAALKRPLAPASCSGQVGKGGLPPPPVISCLIPCSATQVAMRTRLFNLLFLSRKSLLRSTLSDEALLGFLPLLRSTVKLMSSTRSNVAGTFLCPWIMYVERTINRVILNWKRITMY